MVSGKLVQVPILAPEAVLSALLMVDECQKDSVLPETGDVYHLTTSSGHFMSKLLLSMTNWDI